MRIQINPQDLASVKSMLVTLAGEGERVNVRAINTAIKGTKTDVSKKIRSDLNLKKTYVDKKIETKFASFSKPSGRVDVNSEPVGLINFKGTRPTLKGVSIKIKTAGPRKIYRHAFVKTINRAENVWWREYRPPERKKLRPRFPYAMLPKPYRLPIVRLTYAGIIGHLSEPAVIGRAEEKATDRYLKEAERQIDRVFSRL